MNINRVTFTGPDDTTKVSELVAVQKEYPFVEWGILMSSSTNRNRTPSEGWIGKLRNLNLNLALHLCGSFSREILSKGNPFLPFEFFQRCQLNFNFSYTQHDLGNFSKVLDKYKNVSFILQYNKSNNTYVNTICNDIISSDEKSRTHILYDSSGGRGTEISQIQSPFTGFYTGYSGGLRPENVASVCEKISKKFDGDVWIDMESGVRTNDRFDIDKVIDVCEKVKNYIISK